MITDHKPLDIVVEVGDIHAGMYSNSYERFDTVKAFFLEQLLPKIKQLKEENLDRTVTLLLLGDTFDIKQQISIVIQCAILQIFESIAEFVDIYVIVGNHDMPIADNPNINSVKTLSYMPGICLVDHVTELTNVNGGLHVLIPFTNTKEKELELIQPYENKDAILHMHTEIAGFHYEGVPVDHSKHNHINDFVKFKRVRSGHIHKKQEINNILFTGTPYHIRKGEDGNDTGYYVCDYKNDAEIYIENKISPRYITVDYEFFREMEFEDAKQLISNNYVDIKTPYALTNPVEKIELIDKYAQFARIFEFSSRKPTDIKIDNLIGTSGVEIKPISIQSTIKSFFEETNSFKAQKNLYMITEDEKKALEDRILKSYETHKLTEVA